MAFITARDGFYMASVSEAGWPSLQHRGGPNGFVKVISPTRIAIADFRRNLQHMSLGNLAANNRASLFFMDYPNRHRLKVMARARAIPGEEDGDLIRTLAHDGYRARIECALVSYIEAFDWNCSQHITQRFTEDQWAMAVD